MTNRSYWLPQVSATFHGRDVFAPVAAYLASGGPLSDLGDPIQDPVDLMLPRPTREAQRVHGTVVDVDRFGNAITNIGHRDLGGQALKCVEVAGARISGISTSYDVSRALVAVFDSQGRLEIAEPGGNAAKSAHISVGDTVEVYLQRPSP